MTHAIHEARHQIDHAISEVNGSSLSAAEKRAIRWRLNNIDAQLRPITNPDLYGDQS